MHEIRKLFHVETQHKFIKSAFDILGLKLFCKVLNKFNIPPNAVSVVSILFGLTSIRFLFVNHNLFILFLCFHVIVDMLDGYYAREFKRTSTFGLYLDRFGDITIYIFLLLKSIYFIDAFVAFYIVFLMILHMGLVFKYDDLYRFPPNRIFIYFYLLGFFEVGLIIQSLIQSYNTGNLIISLIKRKKEI